VLTVVASVATSYIVLRSLDRQLEIAQATTRNFERTLRIFERRFNAGLVANTELTQVRSQLQQARAAIPAFEQAIAAQENLISILLGQNPGPIARGKTIDQLAAPEIPGTCRRRCCSGVRTSCRPNRTSSRPMPASARHARCTTPISR